MVTEQKKGSKWTPEEDAFVRAVYPTQGWRAVHARFPHRTADTIRAHAKSLGAMSRKRQIAKRAADPDCLRLRKWAGPVDRERVLAWRLQA